MNVMGFKECPFQRINLGWDLTKDLWRILFVYQTKKTESLACIGNDQNAQRGGCFGFNVLFWLKKCNQTLQP